MVSSTVLTQQDVTKSIFTTVPDVIGIGSYTVDVPGPVQIVVGPNGDVVSNLP